ncbi:MAG: MFS transporter [Treponema sp.]|jgi:predicted MFS family arabinose efflux permease|nr:MFS transporter [Treponema sp.]
MEVHSAAKKQSLLAVWREIYRPEVKIGRYLSVLALWGISYGFYRGIQDNYLAQVVGITSFERGIVEFFREIPGLLVVLILAWMYKFTATRIFKISIAVAAAGVTGLLLSGTGKFIVVVFMVLFSFGEHIIMPVRTTLSLSMSKPEKAGASLGIISMIGNIGNIVGFLVVTGLFILFGRLGFSRIDLIPFKIIFAVSTALMTLAFFISLAMKETNTKINRRRFYFHKKFLKYYMLEVFYGARKQIFITFAPYVLILYYGADTSIISLLLAICAAFGIFFSPLMGKVIDHLGYKFVMVTDTLLLIAVCFFYGFAHRIFPPNIAFIVVCINYVLDSIVSLASMASNVYVQDIADNGEEITATLSTGISVNHVISILIALLGGWIWKMTGIEALFTLSAFLGLLNTIYAATIKKSEKRKH